MSHIDLWTLGAFQRTTQRFPLSLGTSSWTWKQWTKPGGRVSAKMAVKVSSLPTTWRPSKDFSLVSETVFCLFRFSTSAQGPNALGYPAEGAKTGSEPSCCTTVKVLRDQQDKRDQKKKKKIWDQCLGNSLVYGEVRKVAWKLFGTVYRLLFLFIFITHDLAQQYVWLSVMFLTQKSVIVLMLTDLWLYNANVRYSNSKPSVQLHLEHVSFYWLLSRWSLYYL